MGAVLLVAGLAACTASDEELFPVGAGGAANYPAYDSADDLEAAANLIARAEVLEVRPQPGEPGSVLADVRVLAVAKGEAVAGDQVELHYTTVNSDKPEIPTPGDEAIFFAEYYPDDAEAYLLTPDQAFFRADGTSMVDGELALSLSEQELERLA